MHHLKNIWLLVVTLIVTGSAYAHFDYEVCPECSGSGGAWEACWQCGGSGEQPYFIWVACDDCSGTGEILGEACVNCDGSGETMEAIWGPCSSCDGMGASTAVCATCDGSGVIETESFNLLALYCAEIHQRSIHIAA